MFKSIQQQSQNQILDSNVMEIEDGQAIQYSKIETNQDQNQFLIQLFENLKTSLDSQLLGIKQNQAQTMNIVNGMLLDIQTLKAGNKKRNQKGTLETEEAVGTTTRRDAKKKPQQILIFHDLGVYCII